MNKLHGIHRAFGFLAFLLWTTEAAVEVILENSV
jgi:hypothetical protein